MSGFLKKALGLFVEFDENATPSSPAIDQVSPQRPASVAAGSMSALSHADLDKFEKHFDKLFEQANLPGPDYYEFWKMMETLEMHIPVESARISAVFASLSIQGMTKERLIETAQQYQAIIQKDKTEFESAVNTKVHSELETRKTAIQDLEKKIVANSEMIQSLTKDITESQIKIAGLKSEITEEENKIVVNKQGYTLACSAMLNKISQDIQKIQTSL